VGNSSREPSACPSFTCRTHFLTASGLHYRPPWALTWIGRWERGASRGLDFTSWHDGNYEAIPGPSRALCLKIRSVEPCQFNYESDTDFVFFSSNISRPHKLNVSAMFATVVRIPNGSPTRMPRALVSFCIRASMH
jgi:hypothetical protein